VASYSLDWANESIFRQAALLKVALKYFSVEIGENGNAILLAGTAVFL
jgi:hypothetical protein